MVCGVLSVATFWLPPAVLAVSLALGVVAVVLSNRARAGAGGGRQALAGLVCGYLGIVLAVANGLVALILSWA